MHWVDLILIIIILTIIVGIGLVVNKLRKYNVEVVLRYCTSKGRRIKKDKGIFLENAKGYKVFKLLLAKDILHVPSSDVVDLKNNGKYFVEMYVDEEGNYSWVKDRGKIKTFTPVSTNRNNILASQIQKANEKGSHWKQNIGIYAGMGALIIVLAIVLFGIGEPINAIKDFTTSVSGDFVKMQQLNVELAELLQNMQSDIQKIESSIPINRTLTPPN